MNNSSYKHAADLLRVRETRQKLITLTKIAIMNFDFSIESSIDRIQNARTKEYFKEVYQTFVNGNYRSSIVMLYSVLICDLVYKLRDLRDIYNEVKAKKILDDIEELQKQNPNSPDWESKLIEFIKTRTSLLEPSDIVAIESLQKFRHLSAHPVLNNSDLLYSPNRDTVQALIRNILEGVLTNPPFFSNRIFDIMLEDLAEVKDKIYEDSDLEKYVKARYINRLKENDFRKIFRSLWKVIFITDDKESIENRNINYRVLKIFTSHNKQICIDLIKSEAHYYSNINRNDQISLIVHYLSLFPEFYNQLEKSIKLLIDAKITDESDYQFMAWFIKPSLAEHIKSLKPDELSSISSGVFEFMKSLAKQNSCYRELVDFGIEYFGSSNSYDATQNRYNHVIKNILDDLSLVQTQRILKVSEDNDQIYHRIGMKQKLRAIAEKYEAEIDKSLYPTIIPITI